MGTWRIFGYFSLLRVYIYMYITRDNTKYSQLFAIPSKKQTKQKRLWNTFTDCVMMIISVAEHWEGPEQHVLTLCITVMKQSQHQQELEPGMVRSHLHTLGPGSEECNIEDGVDTTCVQSSSISEQQLKTPSCGGNSRTGEQILRLVRRSLYTF